MSGAFKIEFNIPGFNELRNSPAILADLTRRGKAIAAAAGGEQDFAVISQNTKSRARVVVITATIAAMRAEAIERSLTTALDAGRD